MDIEKQLLEIKKMLLELESAITKQSKEKPKEPEKKEQPASPKYLTIKQFCKTYPWPSESAMRSIILKSDWKQNNFQEAFFRVNRRVLINVDKFWEIAKSQELRRDM